MDKLRDRVLIELEQWPEHAVLNDVRFYLKLIWKKVLILIFIDNNNH